VKVVLDSNVYISSFFWKGNPRKVYDRVTDGKDIGFINDAILHEIFDVMSRPKFKASIDEIKSYVAIIDSISIKIEDSETAETISRDRDDDKIIDCAVKASEDFIISGDDDLLVLKQHKGIFIVTPSEYLKLV
jgi:putative PIN family toxin of toxin-antitoxin system